MIKVVYTGTREPGEVSGVELVHLPMLARLALPLRADLDQELHRDGHPTRHAVFFSRNAAEYALDALGRTAFSATTVWAVGEQTASWLGSVLDQDVRHPAREDFVGLVEELQAAIGADDLVVSFELEGTDRPLEEVGLPCRVVSVPTYKTVGTNWDDLDGVLRRIAPQWVVFASPRAFDVFRENLHHRVVGDCYRVAAIGPSTRDAIEQAGDRVDFVPERPDLEALLGELAAG